MAIFGKKETSEEKQQREMEKFMKKYQLEDIDEKDLIILKKIATDMIGNEFFKTGMVFSHAKSEDLAKVTYLSALVEQNWMIIRQLSRLNSNIEKLTHR
jgi:hypothetical protein